MISSLRRRRKTSNPPRRKRSTHCKACKAPLFSLVPTRNSSSSAPNFSASSSPAGESQQDTVELPVLLKQEAGSPEGEKRLPPPAVVVSPANASPSTPEATRLTRSAPPSPFHLDATTVPVSLSASPVDSFDDPAAVNGESSSFSVNAPSPPLPTRAQRISFSGGAIGRLRDGIQSAGSNRYRHYCRACGFSFCARCSSHRSPLPQYGYLFPVRVCKDCFASIKSEEEEKLRGNGSSPSIGVILSGFAKENTKIGQWNSRHLVLTNAALHVFRPQEGTLLGEERCHFMLESLESRGLELTSSQGEKRYCLGVRSERSSRKHVFALPAQEDRDLWLETIAKAKEGSLKPVYLSKGYEEDQPLVEEETRINLILVDAGPESVPLGARIIGWESAWGSSMLVRLSPAEGLRVYLSSGMMARIGREDMEKVTPSAPFGRERQNGQGKRVLWPLLQIPTKSLSAEGAKDQEGEEDTPRQIGLELELTRVSEGGASRLEEAAPSTSRFFLRLLALSPLILGGLGVVCIALSSGVVQSSGTLRLESVLPFAAGVVFLCLFMQGVAHPPTRSHAKSWKVTFLGCRQGVDLLEALQEDKESCIASEVQQEAQERAEEDSGGLPLRFLKCTQGNVEEAKRRYAVHQQWVKDFNIPQLLNTPQPYFETIKRCYPSYFHGYDKLGHPVNYEIAGTCRRSFELLREENVPIDSLLLHYAFVQEYLWKYVDNRPWPRGRVTKIMDLKGISFSDMAGPLFDFVKTLSAFVGPNYPERLHVVFLINVPTWFNVIWKMMYPLVHPVTRQKTKIYKGGYEKELLELVDASQVPKEYGGCCECPGGCATHSELEKQMGEFVRQLNAKGVQKQDSVDLPSSGEE